MTSLDDICLATRLNVIPDDISSTTDDKILLFSNVWALKVDVIPSVKGLSTFCSWILNWLDVIEEVMEEKVI